MADFGQCEDTAETSAPTARGVIMNRTITRRITAAIAAARTPAAPGRTMDMGCPVVGHG